MENFTSTYAKVIAFIFLANTTILVANEEILVALCFALFIMFSLKYFGPSLEESLEERKQAIQQEFIQAFLLEKSFCEQAQYEYQQPMKNTAKLSTITKTLFIAQFLWYNHFRNHTLKNQAEQSLRSSVQTILGDQKNQIDQSAKGFQENWLDLMAAEFETSVLAQFQASQPSSKSIQKALIDQSIQAVQKELAIGKTK